MNARKENSYKIAGMVIPIVISFAMIAVQWGVITTKLSIFEGRIDELIISKDKQGEILNALREDVAFIKGKLKD